MTAKHDTAELTPKELETLNSLQLRHAAAEAARTEAALAPIRQLVALDAFRAVLGQASALRAQLDEGGAHHAHLSAMVVGMTNLQRDVAG